ncbi:MAG TPA: hypothetical protein VFK68_03865 [Propionibacteriaceae bacterium]|nr:hypothetical protein [Propionibacteriaceae bacterium]
MKHIATMAAVGAAVCAVSLATALPASAAGTPSVDGHSTLAQIQAAATTATSDRIASLKTAIGKVDANRSLTAGDRSTILARLNADLTAMSSLASKIAADTTVSTALSDYHDIFTGYRVYAVALPQAFDAAAADRLTGTAIPALQSAHDKLARELAAHPTKWTDTLKAQLADMQAKISDASTHANGLAARALAVTPAQYNADKTVMTGIRADLKTSVGDTKAAAADGHALVEALK